MSIQEKYKVLLKFVKEQSTLDEDILVSMREAVHNDIESEKARNILKIIGEL